MASTPSNVNKQFAASLGPYSVSHGLNPAQTNAAKHAIASAVYSEEYGSITAAFLGATFEAVNGGYDSY